MRPRILLIMLVLSFGQAYAAGVPTVDGVANAQLIANGKQLYENWKKAHELYKEAQRRYEALTALYTYGKNLKDRFKWSDHRSDLENILYLVRQGRDAARVAGVYGRRVQEQMEEFNLEAGDVLHSINSSLGISNDEVTASALGSIALAESGVKRNVERDQDIHYLRSQVDSTPSIKASSDLTAAALIELLEVTNENGVTNNKLLEMMAVQIRDEKTREAWSHRFMQWPEDRTVNP